LESLDDFYKYQRWLKIGTILDTIKKIKKRF
jgi:hypothetical protein